jgi:hypothetical protein
VRGGLAAFPANVRGLTPDRAAYAERVTPLGRELAATGAGVCPFRPMSGV